MDAVETPGIRFLLRDFVLGSAQKEWCICCAVRRLHLDQALLAIGIERQNVIPGAVSLLVRDYDEAIAYYTSVLGFMLVEDTTMPDGKRWVVVVPPGATETRLVLARAVKPEDLYLYQTGSGDTGRFGVLYGSYASRDDASTAMGALPAGLRQFRPYVRTVESVRDDVRRAPRS